MRAVGGEAEGVNRSGSYAVEEEFGGEGEGASVRRLEVLDDVFPDRFWEFGDYVV